MSAEQRNTGGAQRPGGVMGNRRRGPMGGPMGGIGMPVQKAKNFKASLKRLIGYLKPHRINLIIVLIFAIASTTFSIFTPKISGKAINKLQDGYMARQMLQKMSDAQKEAVDQINSRMAEAQARIFDATVKQMSGAQKKAVDSIAVQMSDVQKKLTAGLKAQMQQMQAPAGGIPGTAAQGPQADPGAMAAIQEFLKLPSIDAITDPGEKADTIIKMLDLLSKMPNAQQGGQMDTDTLKRLLRLPAIDTLADRQEKIDTIKSLTDLFAEMPDTQQSAGQATDPAAMDTLIAVLELPDINSITDQKQKNETVVKLADLLGKLPDMQQDGEAQSSEVKEMNPGELSVLKELLQLPMLSSVTDPAQKADICRKFIDIGKSMPADMQKGSQLDAENKVTLTDDQIEGVLKAIEETDGKIDFTYIGWIALLLIGIYLVSAGFSLVMGLVMSGVSQRTVRDLRSEVDKKLNRLPLKYFDMHPHGDILSRVTNDIDTIATTLQQSLTQIITSVISILGYIIMMLTISPVLTLIVIATLPLYILATTFIARTSQKFFAAQQKELGQLSGHVEEMYTGHKIVKAFGQEKNSIEKFEGTNGALYTAGWKAQFVSGIMFPLMNFISNLGYVFICIVGGIWITLNRLKIGDIIAFIQYSRQFTMPIVQTANIANIIQSTVACAERVFEVLDEEEEVPELPDAKVIEYPKGEVRFENVDFRYVEEVPLIEDMNLEVKRGETIAIVGPTGAGKTTLVNLLMRFYELKGGVITVDGVDIKDMKRSSLRRMFGMVLQDTWLFNGSIKENIAYGKENATLDEVRRAAKAAHADHFIRTLPEGYDTVLNEEATNISQGQKQLLTIARAILADPAILILDEATSSVDTRTEVLIQKAMANLMKDRTSFVIAHRLSTIRDAGLILVMNHGRIIEQGSHKELLEKGGFYADLYNSQFTGANLDDERAG
jgi:ATP-binding cassette subfamily B multidrug efflux pump